MLERYLIPLAPYVLLTLACIVALIMIVSFSTELKRLKARAGIRQAEQELANRELAARLAQLSERLRDTEERSGMLVPPPPPPSGLNLNKRAQAIRMSRRGEPAGNIAASLNLPRGEVELLLKVYNLALDARPEPPN
jgi:hypothetical protein